MKGKVTIRDVATAAGVSVATVSYILNGKKKVSEQTKQRVLGIIKEMEYVPDLNARGLSVRDTKLIGVVVPQTEPGSMIMFRNQFYSEILGSIELYARQNGYHVLISATDVTEDYLRLIQERNLDGVIIIGTYQNEFFTQLKQLEVPVVLVDSYCVYDWFHAIRIDDEDSTYRATRYMLEAGHEKIALVVGQMHEDGVMKKRFSGYKKALEESGIFYHDEYVYEGNVDYDSGAAIACQMVKEHNGISAVVATADIFAIGLMKGFYEAGYNIPEDISIIGFDDLEISQYLTPGLTTMKQPIMEKGKRAVELLVGNMEDTSMKKVEEIFPVELIERSSVKIMKKNK